ncbi:MAG: UvrD-helicase domain-containing protein [Clostridia bacterium]|nr:UvrD-helicase domain-containing protein [Clostridia bacterium]
MKDLSTEFLKLRKQIIEMQYTHLNDMQKKAVFQTEGAVLILAGAGSGKTTVLVNRILNLIRFGNAYHSDIVPSDLSEDDIGAMKDYISSPDDEKLDRLLPLLAVGRAAPYGILAITFTNKAAGELKERLSLTIGPEANDIWACTFHSACVRILRRNSESIGFDSSFSIYDADDTLRLIKACEKELNIEEKRFPARAVYSQISNAKNKLIDAEDFSSLAQKDFYLSEISRIYTLYQKRLTDAGAMDFDDLIFNTVRLLTENESVRDFYQRKFKYVLVDEYQDTNHAQYRLVSLLSGKYKNICVVGDDDQSIYKFRGATIENILSFEDEYEDALIIRLEQNYRSTKNILDAANSVIKNNKTRREKTLWTDNISGEKIKVYDAASDEDEARFVASTVSRLVSSQNKKYSDFAVLYRMNAQSYMTERAFSQNGIPYRLIGGVRFYERAEIKDIVAYLQLIDNTADDLRLKRIINVPKRGIGQATVDALEAAAADEGISMFDAAMRSKDIPALSSASKKLHVFTDIINELRALKDHMPLNDFVFKVMDKSGIWGELYAQNTEESRQRIANLERLVSNAADYKDEDNPDNPSLRRFLEEIALYTDLDSHDSTADSVTMLTIHSAKGLEFDTVFLIGADEGVFPSSRSFDFPDEIEEERRLCYVAVTRAKRTLYITRAQERLVFGKTMYPRPSRFLEEIDEKFKEPAVKRAQSKQMPRYSSGNSSYYNNGSYSGGARAADTSSMFKSKTQKTAQPGSFMVGERVRHRKFGDGMIISVKPMSGDTFLEVAFDSVGTKKLMANLAGLKKI